MVQLYEFLFYKPILNSLIFLYSSLGNDLGVAIILLTVILRVILFPIFQRSARYQAVVQKIQPEVKRIQEKYKNDKERQVQETMALYRTHHINPFSGFLFLLIQLPILITLFHILNSLGNDFRDSLYSFIAPPGNLNPFFLGLINLQNPNIVIVLLAAGAQYLQGTVSLPVRGPRQELTPTERMGRNMVFIAPIFTLVLFASLPAAVGLYWLLSSVISILQQLLVNRELTHG